MKGALRQQEYALIAGLIGIGLIVVLMLGNQLNDFGYFERNLRGVFQGTSAYLATALLAFGLVVPIVSRKAIVSVLFLAASLLFLRIEGVDLPLLAAAAKLLAVAGGGLLLAALLVGEARDRRVRSLFLSWPSLLCYGAALQVVIVLLLSAWSAFDFVHSVAADVILALGGLVAAMHLEWFPRVTARSTLRRISNCAPLIAAMSIVAARSKALPYEDFDTAWYGLGLEYGFSPHGSAYAPTGFANMVHYYPKLGEFMQFSLSFVPDYSYQVCFNVVLLFLLGLIIFGLLVRARFSAATAGVLAALLCSTPAFVHVGAGTKGDVLGMFLLIAGLSFLIQKNPHSRQLSLALASCSFLLSSAAKLTAMIYLAVPLLLVAGALLGAVYRERRVDPLAAFAAGCGALTVLLVSYRTWLLTGFPFVGPTPLIDVARLLGFRASNDVVIFEIGSAGGAGGGPFERIRDVLLHPYLMDHIWFSWPSVTVLVGLLLVATTRKIAVGKAWGGRALAAAVVGYLFVISCAFFLFLDFNSYGGDGNYFLPGIAAAILLPTVLPRARSTLATWPLFVGIAPLVICNMLLATVASWGAGLPVARLDLMSDTIDTPAIVSWRYDHLGLKPVVKQLKNAENCRVLALPGGNGTYLLYLPCRVELLPEISWPVRGLPPLVSSTDRLARYVCWSGTNLVLEQKGAAAAGQVPPSVAGLKPFLSERVATDKWALWAVDRKKLCH